MEGENGKGKGQGSTGTFLPTSIPKRDALTSYWSTITDISCDVQSPALTESMRYRSRLSPECNMLPNTDCSRLITTEYSQWLAY